MKDMYTFDATVESALETYDEVQTAYAAFFTALKIPFIRAQASSGDMGGDLSHEYHLLTAAGEDRIMVCGTCNHAANSEVVETSMPANLSMSDKVSRDQQETQGGQCPQCGNNSLRVERALEIGHTFHLGTRYSKPLGATVATASGGVQQLVPMQMGCHGIGVSRLMGAIAGHGVDPRGLRWPSVIAPYHVVVIYAAGLDDEAVKMSDEISHHDGHKPVDVVLDYRANSFPWKLKDADSVGYPIIVVLGKAWKEAGLCEIQCRSLGVVEQVPPKDIPGKVLQLLQRC